MTNAKTTRNNKPGWISLVAQYHRPDPVKSIWQIVTTFVPYLALWYLMYRSLDIGYWFTLILAVPASLLVVRIFVLQHDCGHGSFFASRRTNNWIGIVCSLFTFVPFYYWRRTHSLHHAAAGDLEHRGIGDFYTMTVAEYVQKSRWEQMKYRLYRNPIVMFVIAPVFVFLIGYRFDYLKRRDWTRERKGLFLTNVALLVMIILMCLAIGPKAYVMVQLPIMLIATSIGSWFFFVQHNYEDAYWASRPEWDYTTAALQGSSYYKLPKILQWFSGNIGFHHIHHLSPKIPNYLLEQCHNDNPEFQSPVTLTLLTGFRTTGLSLWDEKDKKLISFRQFSKLQRVNQVAVRIEGSAVQSR